jgi:hypothetical protein
MDPLKIGEADLLRFGGQLDRRLHRSDVAEHLDGDTIGCFPSLGENGFGCDQAANSGIEALDPRRGDRLGSEEEAGRPGAVASYPRSATTRTGAFPSNPMLPIDDRRGTMKRSLAVFLTAAVMMIAACGGGEDDAGTGSTTAASSSPTETTAPMVGETVAPLPGGTLGETAAGAFSVDLEGARLAAEIIAGYADLSVQQVAAGDADVWVTVGDTPNEGDAYVARYDLAGSEVARVAIDGRPLGVVGDPNGRGVWFGDNFFGRLEFIDGSTDSIATSIEDGVSSLSTSILDAEGSIWSMRSISDLIRVDPVSGEIADEIETSFQSSQSDLLLVDGTLWGSEPLADTVTAIDLATGSSRTFMIPGADAMAVLDDGTILVSGDELATIDPATGSVDLIGAVVYPDKNEFFPAKFTALTVTGSGLYGFDGVHGRLVRLDLATMSADVIDEVPIGFVGVGDIAESGDGALWLVVTGEETDTDTEDRLRRYPVG